MFSYFPLFLLKNEFPAGVLQSVHISSFHSLALRNPGPFWGLLGILVVWGSLGGGGRSVPLAVSASWGTVASRDLTASLPAIMSVCTCVWECVNVSAIEFVYFSEFVNMHMRTCVSLLICVGMQAPMCACVGICTCMFVHMYVHMSCECLCTWVLLCTCEYVFSVHMCAYICVCVVYIFMCMNVYTPAGCKTACGVP